MGLKYFCEYRTLNTNELWKVEIHFPSYSDEPIRKIGAAGQTCIIDWSGGDKLLDKFAIGSSASITLLFDDALEVNELQNIGDKTVVVKVYNNGGTNLYWQGFLISDGVQHPDSGVMTAITLTAVDMLEASNEIPFTNTDVGAVTIGGVTGSDKSPLNWIRKCLAFTSNMGNDMPIRWSCSIKNSQYPTDDFFGGRTSLIYNYEDFLASRQDTFVGWMLENIVKSAGCLLFQNGGYWYIVSLKDLAVSSTLTFNQITAGLGAKTATTTSINLSKVLPTKLNESTYTMVQKPISKVKSTYNHSMQSNIIPNGGFDIVESGKPLYWEASSVDISITSRSPINGRKTGYAAGFVNSGSNLGYATFNANGLSSMPLDANILFKSMQWGFTFMPVNFPINGDGFIDWSSDPLQIAMSYTGYNGGELQKFFLNKFGFWQGVTLDFDSLRITSVESYAANTGFFVYFTGDAYTNQYYSLNYVMGGVHYSFQVTFLVPTTLSDAVQQIADETGGYYNVGDFVSYEFASPVSGFSASVFDPIGSQIKIDFEVEGMKNFDVATVQFQSKGNQGNVLMPNPGVLDQMRALESGKLELLLVIKPDQEVVFDDLYMNVSSDKEYWDISDGSSDGKEEYELDISSSFSGFMTSSYKDNFATSDLSMIMSNGVDTGTLTEIFGKTALRMLSSPTKKIDADLEGSVSLLNLLQYSGGKYLPLKASVNTETNESKLTIFELSYDNGLALTSVHKSTGDGENSGVGGTGTGGGSGGGGGSVDTLQDVTNRGATTNKVITVKGLRAQDLLVIPSTPSTENNSIWLGVPSGTEIPTPVIAYLSDLEDVSLSSLQDGQSLKYNIVNGKWENATFTNGSVTSVAMTVPTGLSVVGSPITSTGTFAVTFETGYSIPTIVKQTQWDDAYTDRFKWDGGSSGLVPATAITSLGLNLLYQPLEDQRLSKTDNVEFNKIKAVTELVIPTISSTVNNSIWLGIPSGTEIPTPVIAYLSDLEDVSLSGLQDGQSLKYNIVTGKWENATFQPVGNYQPLEDQRLSTYSVVTFPVVRLNGGDNTYRELMWLTNGVIRWDMYMAPTAETGGNQGGNLSLNAYADDGSPLHNIWNITRSTGRLTYAQSPYKNSYKILDQSDFTNLPSGGDTLQSVRNRSNEVYSIVDSNAAYVNAAIQVLSTNKTTANDALYAPRISFHWPDRAATQIRMAANGAIEIVNAFADGYENFKAYTITSHYFFDQYSVSDRAIRFNRAGGRIYSIQNGENGDIYFYDEISAEAKFGHIHSTNTFFSSAGLIRLKFLNFAGSDGTTFNDVFSAPNAFRIINSYLSGVLFKVYNDGVTATESTANISIYATPVAGSLNVSRMVDLANTQTSILNTVAATYATRTGDNVTNFSIGGSLTTVGAIGTINGNIVTNTGYVQGRNGIFDYDIQMGNYGAGITGQYSSTRYQAVFNMGSSYKIPLDGTTLGNQYGIAWSYQGLPQTKAGLGHQMLITENGVTQTAIGNGIWTRASIEAAGDIRTYTGVVQGYLVVGSTVKATTELVIPTSRPASPQNGSIWLA